MPTLVFKTIAHSTTPPAFLRKQEGGADEGRLYAFTKDDFSGRCKILFIPTTIMFLLSPIRSSC